MPAKSQISTKMINASKLIKSNNFKEINKDLRFNKVEGSDKLDFKVYSDPLEVYSAMLKDISSAKKHIYLETYIYDPDVIGAKFRDVLIQKCNEGVVVKVLIDAWGSDVTESFLEELILAGGEVRFFRKFAFKKIFKEGFFLNHHRRDHRKLLVIDDKVAYMGSSNIASRCLNWRESNLRIKGTLVFFLRDAFLEMFELHKVYIFDLKNKTDPLIYNNYELIRDIPSFIVQPVKNKMIKMIKEAKKEILIEMPYFVPDSSFRRALKRAVKRKVKITLILPLKSDVKSADILRELYLGSIYRRGINIFYYIPKVLHSKFIVVDCEKFILGSSNLDYRSFIHQFEICLYGEDKVVSKKLLKHFSETLNYCVKFDYVAWKNRHFFQKLLEKLLNVFKKYA